MLLRAQFIQELCGTFIKQKNLTFTTAVDKALKLETSKCDNNEIIFCMNIDTVIG